MIVINNYHRHTSYSNIYIADSAATNEDYAKRAVELGHKVLSSVEHGWQGYYFETYELAKKYNLKFIFGAEAYWVKDRHEKDRTNGHIILLAKNEKGRQAINEVLSTANEDGYYFRPRVDLELLLTLPPDDVMVTSACIAFWHYDDIEEIVQTLHDHFKSNFYLEIQYHNTEAQINLNRRILDLSQKYGIEMIVGMDSHYIYPEQAKERDYILAAKNIRYEDEDGWFMDYPDDETTMQRFLVQKVFTREQIQQAMDNTDILLTFEDYDVLPDGTTNPIFTKDIKLPTLYDGAHIIDGKLFPKMTQEERNKEYSKLITRLYKEYLKTAHIAPSQYDIYLEGIGNEVRTVKDTNMSDYFLIDYYIVKRALEKGGILTRSGRGSSVGYMTNTLLGFSKVDRFQSPIKLYPERFISKSRILETKSLPDIDLNWGTPEIAEEAQEEILGKDHAYPMIAFGTAKKKSAFKLYARAQNMDFELANTISAQIEKYDDALKYADDDERDEINIYDYVDEAYHSYIDASQKYWGIVMDKKKAPCSYLLYNGSIRREIGLIKCKSESTKKEYITAVIDGAIAENYKFLKNDILKVDVVSLIDQIYRRIGIEPHSVSELMELVQNDPKVWDIYAKGLTVGVNQCEKASTTRKVMRYQPKNVSELAAFIAAIRPAFKSMYSKLENRESFSYGIPAFDRILQTKELPQSFILYQEQTMNTLNYAGFPIDECYGIIKAIAKKHPEKVRPLKDRFITGFKQRIMDDDHVPEAEAQENSEKVWKIISDSCGYGFNCVSGHTRMKKSGCNGKFEPTVEEMYKIMHDRNYAIATGHFNLHKKYQLYGYGFALSMFDDNIIRQNQIIDIAPAGVRQTYEIKTSTGRSIICTDNHKFPTPYGKKRLDELKIGDLVYCMGEYEQSRFNSALTDGTFEKNYPHKGDCGFRQMPNGAFAIYQNERTKHKTHKNSCECCGTQYSKEKHFELHHKDFNRQNNDPTNFEWLCNSCHKQRHYDKGRTKRYEKGIPTYLDSIVSIVPVKEEMTYDVEMADPAHTFVSENGLVVSNSAHAYCMALDSLYNAWQKANYPYEFYEVLLQVFSDKGKKDKVAELKQEMFRGFGISEGKFKFGADNRKFLADPEHHVIYPSLLSIKGLSQGCANDLYDVAKKNTFTDFYSAWKVIRKKKSLNNGKINTLIQIGYFDEFAPIGKIEQFMKALDALFERSQFAKDSVPQEYKDLICKYSEETEKQYRKFDYDAALSELWSILPDTDISLNQRLNYELQNLGYVKTIMPELAQEYCFVQEFECKYKNPKLTLYRLCDGAIEVVKVRRKAYDNAPIEVGDIIKSIERSKEGRWSKDANDEWQQDNENKEVILKKWSFVR